MPVVHAQEVPSQEVFPGVASRSLACTQEGTRGLTVNQVTLSPGSVIPLHTHPTHAEAIIILEGTVEVVLGEEVHTVGPGHAVLVPQGVKHRTVNRGGGPATLLAIFPAAEPQREMLE